MGIKMRQTYLPNELLSYFENLDELDGLIPTPGVRIAYFEADFPNLTQELIRIIPEEFMVLDQFSPLSVPYRKLLWEDIDWNGFTVIDKRVME